MKAILATLILLSSSLTFASTKIDTLSNSKLEKICQLTNHDSNLIFSNSWMSSVERLKFIDLAPSDFGELEEFFMEYGEKKLGPDPYARVNVTSVERFYATNPWQYADIFDDKEFRTQFAAEFIDTSFKVFYVRGTFFYLADEAMVIVDHQSNEACLVVGGMD